MSSLPFVGGALLLALLIFAAGLLRAAGKRSPSVEGEFSCRVCGCSEYDACPEGCWWIPDPKGLGPLCSSCEDAA